MVKPLARYAEQVSRTRLVPEPGVVLRRFEDARTHLWRALDLHHEAGDLVGQARPHIKLAMTCGRAGNSRDDQPHADKALDQARRALDLYRAAGHQWDQANALNSLDLYRKLGDRFFEADVISYLGEAYHAVGQPELARAAWQEALAIFDSLDHPDAERVRTQLIALDSPPAR